MTAVEEKIERMKDEIFSHANSDFEKTIELSNALYEYARSIDHADGMIQAISFKVPIYNIRRSHGELYACLDEMVQLGKQHNILFGVFRAYQLRASAALRQRNYAEAIQYSNMAIEAIGDDARWQLRKANSYLTLGGVYDELGEQEEGLEYHLKGIEIARAGTDVLTLARLLNNTAEIYSRLEEYTLTETYFLEAYRIFGEKKSLVDKSNAAAGLGYCYLYTNRTDDALQYLHEAITLKEQMDMQYETPRLYHELASLYKRAGAYDTAQEMMIKARHSAEDRSENDKHLITNFEAKWSLDEGNYDAAIDLLQKYTGGNTGFSTEALQHTYILLSDAYEHKSNLQQALACFKRADELKTEMLLEKSQSRSKNLMIKYETEKAIREKQLAEMRSHELQQALDDLKHAQSQLVQSEKMASLGVLTAGVAHEINNPINFVSSSIKPLRNDVHDLIEVLRKCEQLQLLEHQEIKELLQRIDMAYTIEEIETLLRGIEDGANRTTEIVKSLRNFTRLDENEQKKTDVNEGIENTLTIMHSSFGKRITVNLKLGALPLIDAYPGQLNQVYMNILSNAIHAIEGEGVIEIETKATPDSVLICIADSGSGMSEEVKAKIFQPFFTTREVGKGAGLGLSIAYSVIEKHGGKISVESSTNVGSKFFVEIPIELHKW